MISSPHLVTRANAFRATGEEGRSLRSALRRAVREAAWGLEISRLKIAPASGRTRWRDKYRLWGDRVSRDEQVEFLALVSGLTALRLRAGRKYLPACNCGGRKMERPLDVWEHLLVCPRPRNAEERAAVLGHAGVEAEEHGEHGAAAGSDSERFVQLVRVARACL